MSPFVVGLSANVAAMSPFVTPETQGNRPGGLRFLVGKFFCPILSQTIPFAPEVRLPRENSRGSQLHAIYGIGEMPELERGKCQAMPEQS